MVLPNILRGKRMPVGDLIILMQSMSYMISAGMNVRMAVDMMMRDPSNKLDRNAMKVMKDAFDSGDTLAQVLKNNEAIFGTGLWEQVEIAQRTGRLPECLQRIADQLKSNRGVVGKIKGAMMYPAMVLVIAAVAGWYLMTNTIPEMGAMMADFGAELPAMTLAMMAICDFMVANGIWVIMVLVAIIFGVKWVLTHPLKMKWHRWLTKFPVAGSIVVNLSYSRAYILVNDMIANGSNPVDSLKVAASAIQNIFISAELHSASRDMEREGHSIAQSLLSAQSMPSDDKLMLSVGQETGREMEILKDLAKQRSVAAEESVARLLELMSPIIMLFVSAIVGVLVVAIYMPMLTMASALS